MPSLPLDIAILVRRVSIGYVDRMAAAPATHPENSFSFCASNQKTLEHPQPTSINGSAKSYCLRQ